MARVAYGERANIENAIKNRVIPKDCIIITKSDTESELFFYNSQGELSGVAERTRFKSKEDALSWIGNYDCRGSMLTVYENGYWYPYIVSDDSQLVPISQESQDGSLSNPQYDYLNALIQKNTEDIAMLCKDDGGKSVRDIVNEVVADVIKNITTTEGGGLKVTDGNKIDIDDSVTFVMDCNDASTDSF